VIEIVCPACQTRYELPDNAIGSAGRKVSCSSCSHKWRAFPEQAAEEAVASIGAALATAAESPEPAPEPEPVAAFRPMAVPDPVEREPEPAPAAEEPVSPPPASGDRDAQMAAIRQMLSDLKETSESAPQRDLAAPRPVERSESPRRAEAPDRDPLKARIEELEGHARAVKGEPMESGYDAHKLRKRHEKRAKQFQRARERRKRSGAFITGFTFVAFVAASLSGLYVLHPKIVAVAPEMEPAMTEYVNTIDRLRIEFDETTAEWRAWLENRIAGLMEKAEEQQQKGS